MWNSSQIQKITAFWTQSKFQRCMNVSLFLFLLKFFNITKQSHFGGKICMVTYYETWKRHMYIYKHTQLNLKGDNGRLTNRINTLQIFDTSILQLSQTSLLFQFQEHEKKSSLPTQHTKDLNVFVVSAILNYIGRTLSPVRENCCL